MGRERGYTEVKTPQLYDSELWKTSGHWGKYRENMFITETEGQRARPQADELPRARAPLRAASSCSYRDLPVRYSEPGLLHRNELSGTLHGLLRVRHFVQDDAHIFCTEEQIEQEVRALPGVRVRDLRAVRLRGRARALDAPRASGSARDEMWDRAEGEARGAC